jgi:thiazole synthase
MELMPFIVPNVEVACLLADAGCVAVRVMASPVASGRGIPDQVAIRRIIEECNLPVIVEGGLGSAKHVALAMELGAAATLVNTALVQAGDPLKMAAAMRQATLAGRWAYEAGPMAGDLVGAA